MFAVGVSTTPPPYNGTQPIASVDSGVDLASDPGLLVAIILPCIIVLGGVVWAIRNSAKWGQRAGPAADPAEQRKQDVAAMERAQAQRDAIAKHERYSASIQLQRVIQSPPAPAPAPAPLPAPSAPIAKRVELARPPSSLIGQMAIRFQQSRSADSGRENDALSQSRGDSKAAAAASAAPDSSVVTVPSAEDVTSQFGELCRALRLSTQAQSLNVEQQWRIICQVGQAFFNFVLTGLCRIFAASADDEPLRGRRAICAADARAATSVRTDSGFSSWRLFGRAFAAIGRKLTSRRRARAHSRPFSSACAERAGRAYVSAAQLLGSSRARR